MKNREEKAFAAKNEMWACGYTIKSWAEERGYSVQEVYKVLTGERKGYYGKSNQIARDLGFFSDEAPNFGPPHCTSQKERNGCE